jgi:hypothetical protein
MQPASRYEANLTNPANRIPGNQGFFSYVYFYFYFTSHSRNMGAAK